MTVYNFASHNDALTALFSIMHVITVPGVIVSQFVVPHGMTHAVPEGNLAAMLDCCVDSIRTQRSAVVAVEL